MKKSIFIFMVLVLLSFMLINPHTNRSYNTFPIHQVEYQDSSLESISAIILHRIKVEPFNLIATLIFFMAIVHTMSTGIFKKLSQRAEHNYEKLIENKKVDKHSKSVKAGIYHLLSEVEVVFGLWTIVLGIAMSLYFDRSTFTHYLNSLHYNEPIFVIVIMSIASSRPILRFFEHVMYRIVRLIGESLEAWWITILVLGPLLGSLITEPAAMTISAYLLSEKVFSINPSRKMRYATLALLFVNVSIGGSLTNFAAPPILLVAEPWEWSSTYLFIHFGWKAFLAILVSTTAYYFFLKHDFNEMDEAYEDYKYKRYIQKRFISQKELEESFDELTTIVSSNTHFFSELDNYSFILKERLKDIANSKLSPSEAEKLGIEVAIDEKYDSIKLREFQRIIPGLLSEDQKPPYRDPHWDEREDHVPSWIIAVHLVFLVWTILNSHTPVLFTGGFLFFLGFFQVTSFYQNRLDLKPALLVAFFLSGLIIHGTLQAWWISPVLGNLPPLSLNLTAIGLTAFNDNAALTYLATLVPEFSESLKYAIVSGAIAGGGLTIIANAPNPVGVSILKKHFKRGISPVMLAKYALLPTVIATIIFNVFV